MEARCCVASGGGQAGIGQIQAGSIQFQALVVVRLKQGDVTQPPNRSCGGFCRNQVVFVKVVFCCAALLLSAVLASATIDSSLQMQLGNPSNATADANNHTHYLIQRTMEALDYNDTLGEANWASWDLTAGDANRAVARPDSLAAHTQPPSGFQPGCANQQGHLGYQRRP